jgi:hypothetical protein
MTWLLNFAAEQLHAWQERRRLRQRLLLRRRLVWRGLTPFSNSVQEFDHYAGASLPVWRRSDVQSGSNSPREPK